MKPQKIVLISAIALSCAAPPVIAQRADDAKGSRDRDEAQAETLSPLGDLRRADQILGEEITDSRDQKVGKVKDLALDLKNGRVAEVIVATAGIVGMDEKSVAVPPEYFRCDRTEQAVRFKGDPALLKRAPEFKLSEWNKSTDEGELRESYQRFGAEPYFFVPRAQLPDAGRQKLQESDGSSCNGENIPPRLGYISRASSLRRTTVRNQQDEKLGRVNNLMIDLSAGRVVEVVLSRGGFLGMNRELSAVPPQAFHWNAGHSALLLDATRESFLAAPHFKASEWGYAYDPDSIAVVYQNYQVQPYFLNAETETGAQNVRARTDAGVAALEQGNARDGSTSDQIRRAFQGNEGLAADSKDVVVETIDGNVTLRGTVATGAEKSRFGEAAAQVAGPDKVNNQIAVRPPSPFPGF